MMINKTQMIKKMNSKLEIKDRFNKENRTKVR